MSRLIFAKKANVFGQKIVLDKAMVAEVHGSNFVIFNYLENDVFFCKSVES